MYKRLIISALFVFVTATPVSAPQPGDIVIFLVPFRTNITPGNSTLIITGTSSGTIDPTGCANAEDVNPRFLQSGKIVNAGSRGRPIPLEGTIIVLYTNGVPQETQLQSGTRIGIMFFPDQCAIGAGSELTLYDRYIGIVQ